MSKQNTKLRAKLHEADRETLLAIVENLLDFALAANPDDHEFSDDYHCPDRFDTGNIDDIWQAGQRNASIEASDSIQGIIALELKKK